MNSFREPNEVAREFNTEPDPQGYKNSAWKHATKQEWDSASEHRREILMKPNGIIFVVAA